MSKRERQAFIEGIKCTVGAIVTTGMFAFIFIQFFI